MSKIFTTIILVCLAKLTFGQITNNNFFNQFDYEIAHYVGMKYNPLKEELGEPYFATILDTVNMTRAHYYKVIVNSDTVDFQVHYDKDLVCNAFSFMVDKDKYQVQIENLTKGYIEAGKWLVTPNRYLVTKTELDNNQVFILYNTTIYPIILAQLNRIQRHLKKGTSEYSNYDIEQAERYIKELNQSILAAATINNITENELNILKKIYKTYTDIIYYDGVKITFIQYNDNVYFNLIPNDIEKLKQESTDEVDFSEIQNLTQF